MKYKSVIEKRAFENVIYKSHFVSASICQMDSTLQILVWVSILISF